MSKHTWILVFTLAFAACGGGEPSPGQPGQPPRESPEDTPFLDPATVIDRPGAGQGVSTLAAVRYARHAGFERVVFEFAGDPHPGYHAEYLTGPAIACGSGHTVQLPGAARLEIRFTPARAHDDQGNATVANRDVITNLPLLRALRLTCDFEADVTWVLALAARRPFRVLELQNPTRIVVDVQDGG